MVKSLPSSLLLIAVLVLLAAMLRADDSANPDPKVVSGVAVAADGKPIAGATVVLIGNDARKTVADRQGRFRFDKVGGDEGTYIVYAFAGNLVAPKTSVEQLSNSQPDAELFEPVRLTLAMGRQAKLVFTSIATGKPVAGVRVQFGFPDYRSIVADKDGVALAGGLLPQRYHVDVFADGFARLSANFAVKNSVPVTNCDVDLDRGGIVRGTVVDDQGKPLPGVAVDFSIEMSGAHWTGDAAETDKDGKFQDRSAPLDTSVEIAFRKKGFASQHRGDNDTIVLSADKPLAELKIVLLERRKRALVGIVTDKSGKPIADAHLTLLQQSLSTTDTDAKGRFRLDDQYDYVSDETNIDLAYVFARGFAPQRCALHFGTDIHPGHATIKLERGHSIHGRVIDDKGTPVANATVMLVSAIRHPFGVGSITDQHGDFAFDSLPADARFTLSRPEGSPTPVVALQLDSPQVVKWIVESPGEIRGRVVDVETGKPIPSFHVMLQPCRTYDRNNPRPISFNGDWWPPGKDIKAADGRFEIGPLANRLSVEMIVSADGYEQSIAPCVVARHAEQTVEMKFALLPMHPDDACTVRGQLLDKDDKPIDDTTVRMDVGLSDNLVGNESNPSPYQNSSSSRSEQMLSGRTDRDGRFAFPNVYPGRYLKVTYRGSDGRIGTWFSSDRTHAGKEMSITVREPQPASIHGTLDQSKLGNATSVQLVSFGPNSAAYNGRVFDRNRFGFADVAPGHYELLIIGAPEQMNHNGRAVFTSHVLVIQNLILTSGQTKELYYDKEGRFP